jgi:hypothetical protein
MSANDLRISVAEKLVAEAVRKEKVTGSIATESTDYQPVLGRKLRYNHKNGQIDEATFIHPKQIIADSTTYKSVNKWATACIKKSTGNKNPRCSSVWKAPITFERDGEWMPLSSIRTIERKEVKSDCGCSGGEALPASTYQVEAVSYADRYSVDGNSTIDQTIGHKEGVVGSNTESLKKINSGDIIVTTAKNGRYIHVSRVIRPATESEASVWVTRGGKMWKYNYKVEPLTDLIKLRKPLSNLSGCCHRGIIKELAKQIQDE